ncbi:MAG: rod shape-determining protein RodA [Fibrobacterota bacterium]
MDTLTKLKNKTDLVSVGLMYILILLGIALIFSATHHNEFAWMRNLYRHQILWMVIGTGVLYLAILIPYRILYDYAYLLYAFTVILLVLVILKGTTMAGATRWFALGSIKIQPSEFAKIGALLALARYFSSHEISFEKVASLITPCALIFIPMALCLKQPDLGTALVFGAMVMPMLFWAGLTAAETFFVFSPVLSLTLAFNTWFWAVFFILLFFFLVKYCRNIFLLSGILLVNFTIGIILPILWNRLHDYQKNRILSFVDPQNDPMGAGYQVIQSQIAVGSGGFFGKGFLGGTQTRLSFLPEQHTDFIFSVLGEQFGFLGCLVVLVIFFVILYRIFNTASEGTNRFLNLLAVGIGAQLAFHVAINIAMTIGLMPVTGLPLPFLSKGGSFLLTCMVLMGIAVSIPKKSGEY